MKTTNEINTALAYCTGTTAYHKYMFNMFLTDGVKLMAEMCEAFWLLDAISSYQSEIKNGNNTKLKQFQVWSLKVNDSCGILTCQTDSGVTPSYKQDIPFTNFPLDEIKLYVIENVILLSMEY